MKSHRGTHGTSVMGCDHTDLSGKGWPKGTAYTPVSRGCDSDTGRTIQTIQIAQKQHQTVLTDGFGELVEFFVD